MSVQAIPRADGRYDLPDLLTLEPDRRTAASLSEKAYYLIRDRLVTLEIPPGATIDERALQRDLDLGRTPIREALRRLADDHLVDVVARRGMFARHVDLSDLRAISEVRVELEGHAGRLAAERATDDDRRAALALSSELEALRGATEVRELMAADHRVHRLVHRATRNRYLGATLEEYYVHSLRMWFLVLDRVAQLDDAVAEHLELLAAVASGDAKRAEEILRHHVTAFERRIRAAL